MYRGEMLFSTKKPPRQSQQPTGSIPSVGSLRSPFSRGNRGYPQIHGRGDARELHPWLNQWPALRLLLCNGSGGCRGGQSSGGVWGVPLSENQFNVFSPMLKGRRNGGPQTIDVERYVNYYSVYAGPPN